MPEQDAQKKKKADPEKTDDPRKRTPERFPAPEEEVTSEEGLGDITRRARDAVARDERRILETAETITQSVRPLEDELAPHEREEIGKAAGMERLPEIHGKVRGLGARTRLAIESAARSPASSAPGPELGRPEAEPVSPSVTEEEKEPVREREKDPALERLDRQLRLAESVERLRNGEQLIPEDRERLSGALEGRGWHRIFNNLDSGDGVVAVMTPPGGETYRQTPDERLAILDGIISSGELTDVLGDADAKELDKALGFKPFGVFGVKRFNDDFFGPQLTDEIILERRRIVSKHLCAQGAGLIELEQGYKDGYFKLPQDRVNDPEKMRAAEAAVSQAVERINGELRAFIAGTAEKAKAEILKAAIPQAAERLGELERRIAMETDPVRRGGLEAERKDALERRKEAVDRYLKLRLFEPILEREGYELNFGMKPVGEPAKDESGKPVETDYSHVELAAAQAFQAAKRARESGEHGRAFRERDQAEIVRELKELRGRIDRTGSEDIIDAQGNALPVFVLEDDGVTRTLNTDVVRDLRKGKFRVRADQEELLSLVQEYMRKVNVLDIVKPYTHGEIRGEDIYGTSGGFTLKNRLENTESMAGRIRSGDEMTEGMRKEAASMLEREGKDPLCTSAMEFHRLALEMNECAYLTIDVLDVGPGLIREYDRLLQRVERGEMSFEEASVIAGDQTTRMMRDFRGRVTRAYREYTGDEEAVPAMLVGGDEATIAIDRSKVEVTDELLMKMRIATKSRVVQTAVGAGGRSNDPGEDEIVKRKEHLKAQKIAEGGSELAKTLERSKRECERQISDLPEEEQERYKESLGALNIRHFAVKQSDGGFKLVVEDPDHPGSGRTLPPVEFQGVLDGVIQLTGRVRRDVLKAHERFFEELKPGYPELGMDSMARVRRMRNYFKKDEEFFEYMDKRFA
jgi:hypothetical protein